MENQNNAYLNSSFTNQNNSPYDIYKINNKGNYPQIPIHNNSFQSQNQNINHIPSNINTIFPQTPNNFQPSQNLPYQQNNPYNSYNPYNTYNQNNYLSQTQQPTQSLVQPKPDNKDQLILYYQQNPITLDQALKNDPKILSNSSILNELIYTKSSKFSFYILSLKLKYRFLEIENDELLLKYHLRNKILLAALMINYSLIFYSFYRRSHLKKPLPLEASTLIFGLFVSLNAMDYFNSQTANKSFDNRFTGMRIKDIKNYIDINMKKNL